MNNIIVTKRMKDAGNLMASNLIDGHLCKNFAGLGGGKDWEEFVATNPPHLDLIEKYCERDVDNFDSVCAIYMAMERERIKEIAEKSNEYFSTRSLDNLD